MVGAAGLASSFAGFGPPANRAARASASSSSFSDGEPQIARRVSLTPDTPARGAFQHCALFKNILVAADGDASARLHVLDVRDWSEKQTIRVGAISSARDVTENADDVVETVPAAVSALAFDGTTIVAATHEGFVHTWRLMARGQKRGYVRLLQPLRVDGVAVTAARILGEPGSKLLACHARSKRAFVVWELDTGKLRGAFNTDGVARGAPLLLVESCATVLACVHADGVHAEEEGVLSEKTKNETETAKREPRNAPSRVVAALLDVRTGEGGALRDSAVLANEGTPSCSAFDGELFVVATSLGFLVAWNLHTGDAPETNAHVSAENARAAVAAVALVPGAGDAPARVLSGGADRALMLWDKALRPLARLELGSPVTCLAAPGPRLAVAGTQDGFVEVVALGPPEDAEPDAALAEAGKKNKNASSSNLPRYALRHDPGSAASSYASFDAFTRRVPVWEGAYVAGGETGGSGGTRERNTNENENASGFSAANALAGSGRSAEEEAARRKREEDEARAKQRAMDGAGVARNPDVRATADGARTCSSPTCVAREDALAPGRKMLRCSRCKRATYCSTHCQRTHWRDGHKSACVAPAPSAAPSAANEAPAPNAAEPKGASTGAATGSTGCEASVSTETRAPAPPAPPAPAPARRALVVESESDESDESDASDASDSEAEADIVARGRDVGAGASFASETSGLEVSSLALNATGDVSDDAAPAHPPWMTAHAPPGVGNVEAGPRRVATEAPPAARAMAVERGASVESRETLAAGSEASGLEPLDEHDLLYELD